MTTRFIALVTVLSVGLIGCFDDSLDTDSADQALSTKADKVVFVHGCQPGPPLAPPPYDNASAAQFWNFAFIPAFQAQGYAPEDLYVWVYSGEVCGDIRDMADDLDDFLETVVIAQNKRVDLVGHSMAGLTIRYFLEFEDGDDLVNDIAILAGTNHGTDLLAGGLGDAWQAQFGAPAYQGARQMANAYACRPNAIDDVQPDLNGCLTPTGRTEGSAEDELKDQAPSGDAINYVNIYLTNDEINLPQHTACLGQEFLGDCSNPVNVPVSHVAPAPDGSLPAHVMMLFDPFVIGTTFDHLQTSEWRNIDPT